MSNFDATRDRMLERPLPNDAEAERAILGAILIDNSLVADAVETLKPEDFYVPSHRRIFLAMCELFSKGSGINQLTIRAELDKIGEVESVGGLSFITNLMHGLPHFVNLSEFIRLVREKSRCRQLSKAGSLIQSEALDAEDESEILLERAESFIYAIRDEGQRESMARISELADSRLEAAQTRQDAKGVAGLPTGYVDLDRMLAGLQKTDLIVIAARPSMGKSALALNLAQNAAETGAHVAFFSLEMSKEQLADRLLSSTARVDSNKLRTGFLSRDDWSRMAGARGEIGNLHLFIDDTAALSILQLKAKARRLASSEKKLDLIIVDYIQLMRSLKSESRFQEVSQIARELKSVAKELSVPLLALSQLSRAPESRTDHRPQLSDLRESGEIEQAADTVAFIYREEQYNRTEENAGIAEIIVAKQRTGPTGTVKLSFIKEFTRFENMWPDDRFGNYSREKESQMLNSI